MNNYNLHPYKQAQQTICKYIYNKNPQIMQP